MTKTGTGAVLFGTGVPIESWTGIVEPGTLRVALGIVMVPAMVKREQREIREQDVEGLKQQPRRHVHNTFPEDYAALLITTLPRRGSGHRVETVT